MDERDASVSPEMICLTWNLEWKSPKSRAGGLILERIAAIAPDVACYTEVVREMVPEGHHIEADSDYGYPHQGDRRKVILWSRYPWTEIDIVGDDEMPTGRFVAGVTGGIRFVGVCIPWRSAHVASGRRDRRLWEDHLAYCRGLGRVLARFSEEDRPLCVLGDFNQTIPCIRQPGSVAKALADALPEGFVVVTEGLRDAERKPLIDHIAVSRGLPISVTQIVARIADDGTPLSDHAGVVARLGETASIPAS